MERQTPILAAVASHLLLTAFHGLVHVAIPVIPDGWTTAFATVSLYLLPVAGAGLAVSGHHRSGAAVLLGSGIASFVFEGTFHFLISNPDHVTHVAGHRTLFGVTAILTTIGNLLLIGAAWFSAQGTSFPGPQQSVE